MHASESKELDLRGNIHSEMKKKKATFGSFFEEKLSVFFSS